MDSQAINTQPAPTTGLDTIASPASPTAISVLEEMVMLAIKSAGPTLTAEETLASCKNAVDHYVDEVARFLAAAPTHPLAAGGHSQSQAAEDFEVLAEVTASIRRVDHILPKPLPPSVELTTFATMAGAPIHPLNPLSDLIPALVKQWYLLIDSQKIVDTKTGTYLSPGALEEWGAKIKELAEQIPPGATGLSAGPDQAPSLGWIALDHVAACYDYAFAWQGYGVEKLSLGGLNNRVRPRRECFDEGPWKGWRESGPWDFNVDRDDGLEGWDAAEGTTSSLVGNGWGDE